MEKKIIKEECTVGCKCWFEDRPNAVWYKQGSTENGYCFKDENAFKNRDNNSVCYIPENDDYWVDVDNYFEEVLEESDGNAIVAGYTYQDILNACDGVEHLAQCVFDCVDWQCPETLLNEWGDNDLVSIFSDVSDDSDMAFLEYLADIYDEDENGSDWGDYYKFYRKHKEQRIADHSQDEDDY